MLRLICRAQQSLTDLFGLLQGAVCRQAIIISDLKFRLDLGQRINFRHADRSSCHCVPNDSSSVGVGGGGGEVTERVGATEGDNLLYESI